MHTLARVAAFVFVLLSLSFLVSALPSSPRTLGAISSVTGTDPVSLVFAKICFDLEAKIKALLACTTIVELDGAFKAVIVVLTGCSDELFKIGAGVTVDLEAKASIVLCICSIIKLIAEVLVQITVKFGLVAIVTLIAKIDLCLKVLLFNLNICIDGILVLIFKALASVTVSLLVKLQLNLCLGVLGL
ncbi:hypothetical protein FS749_008040 [Ceratobasidium sp. UAMH 11750]|nr:hypothetical protein FS749_008040 [Ceratobasidium sp. UAMH 11750]